LIIVYNIVMSELQTPLALSNALDEGFELASLATTQIATLAESVMLSTALDKFIEEEFGKPMPDRLTRLAMSFASDNAERALENAPPDELTDLLSDYFLKACKDFINSYGGEVFNVPEEEAVFFAMVPAALPQARWMKLNALWSGVIPEIMDNAAFFSVGSERNPEIVQSLWKQASVLLAVAKRYYIFLHAQDLTKRQSPPTA
jgi:hypothetical protein